MTDILITRANIIQRLNEIRNIPKQQYSAQQLHGSMMDRTQRKEDVVYQQRLKSQEKKLLQDLELIDNYLASEILPTNGDVPLVPIPKTSLWGNIPLPQKRYTIVESRPRTKRRIR